MPRLSIYVSEETRDRLTTIKDKINVSKVCQTALGEAIFKTEENLAVDEMCNELHQRSINEIIALGGGQ